MKLHSGNSGFWILERARNSLLNLTSYASIDCICYDAMFTYCYVALCIIFLVVAAQLFVLRIDWACLRDAYLFPLYHT